MLFDFDGLLVNTEPLHYAAYMQLSQKYGWNLDWDFARFCHEAHSRAGGFFEALKVEVPHALEGRSKEELYLEKQAFYEKFLEEQPIPLMPGAEEMLVELQRLQCKRAVVTNSPSRQIEKLRAKNSLLNTIPLWITREKYRHPKPSPEGYLLAIEALGVVGKKVIGFEDTLKGVRALLDAGVEAVLVSSPDYRGRSTCQEMGAEVWDRLDWKKLL
ncbi:MAG: hypothetical protein RLZZ453_672 [Chlamydiota bacterium]